MKKILVLLITLTILISGCSHVREIAPTLPVSDNADVNENPIEGVEIEIDMTAKQFEFEPSTITVNKGDTVKLTITSLDVAHGFSLSEFNIDERIEPGQPTKIEFVADKTGTFPFECSIFCGSGHGHMEGTLIVQ